MKKIKDIYGKATLLVMFLLLWGCCSCVRQESFAYHGGEKISFADDSTYFSFGGEPFSVMDTTLQIRVEIIGRPVDRERPFRLRLVEEQTSAEIGVNFDAIAEEYNIPAGECFTHIPVTIHRLTLNDTDIYTMCMELVANEEFELGAVEYLQRKISFSNRLDMPIWWNEVSHWVGEYDVRKYQKFIEIFGRPAKQQDINTNKFGVLRAFKEVKIYFEAHPEFEVSFPDVHWEV